MALFGCHQSIAIAGVGVHEGIGGGVVDLARIPQHAGQGGKQDQKIKRRIPCGFVYIYESRDLGRQYRLQFRRGFFDDEIVMDHSRGVDDAVKPPEFFLDNLDQVENRRFFDHVHLTIVDAGAQGFYLL